jgi:CRISPR-associated endonuclease Cas2
MRAIICYDFSNNSARARFSKVLSKYGFRIQYSVFEFNLDKDTWKKLVEELKKKKFLDGNHNIVIIPITDAVHKKMTYLGNMFLAFDHDTLIYSALGIKGIGKKKD